MNQTDRLLVKWTGGPSRYWMRRIGDLVVKCAKPIRGHPGLMTCEPALWVAALALDVSKRVLQRAPKSADGNLIVANCLALILLRWGYRTSRAKCYDPRRPVAQRRKSLRRVQQVALAAAECLIDESGDARDYPDQEWDMPFSRTARHEPDEMELKRQAFAKGERPKRRAR